MVMAFNPNGQRELKATDWGSFPRRLLQKLRSLNYRTALQHEKSLQFQSLGRIVNPTRANWKSIFGSCAWVVRYGQALLTLSESGGYL
jgi:hypothetical protein